MSHDAAAARRPDEGGFDRFLTVCEPGG